MECLHRYVQSKSLPQPYQNISKIDCQMLPLYKINKYLYTFFFQEICLREYFRLVTDV